MREWFRAQAAAVPQLAALPLVVSNEGSDYGDDTKWIRYSLQTGDARLIGTGSGLKRYRRNGRMFAEIFGPKGEGDGDLSELSDLIEGFILPATHAAAAPAPLISLGEPSTFERPETNRYCQVVSTPVEVDYFS
jgi:hypothetical protein